ncbi:MAG: hypothetical protein GX758_01660 [Tenericutes bacterium]|nr:hypothetical protein [Mycoplasmatota bacterium]
MNKKIILIILALFIGVSNVKAYSAPNLNIIHTSNILTSSFPDYGFGESKMTCSELVGENLAKVLKAFTLILKIAGAIIAIVSGMMAFIPAIVSSNADAFKKATKKFVNMSIVLVLILLLPSLLVLIGNLFNYDLTCIF